MTKSELTHAVRDPSSSDTEADLQTHLAAMEARPPDQRAVAIKPNTPLRDVQAEIDNLRARLHVIQEQVAILFKSRVEWADASAHEQLGRYPWAKLAGAMMLSFLVTRVIRHLPLGAVVTAAFPLLATEIIRDSRRC